LYVCVLCCVIYNAVFVVFSQKAREEENFKNFSLSHLGS
jgi:hypothetical protein